MSKQVNFKIDLLVNGVHQVVQASASTKELTGELLNVQKQAARTAKEVGTFTQSLIALNTLNSVIPQLSSALNSFTDEYRSFSVAMRETNTMAGKGEEDFAKLKDSVTGLAKEIPVTREALARGLYQVISNGVPEDNWIEYLRASAKASVGGIADLNTVVTVTSTLIKNYGLEWSKAGEIQDKIQLTAKNGVTSFEQLGQALPRVAGSAAQVGISIEELMAVFATCTGVTGETAEVSTQLAAVLKALIKPSGEATKTAAAMGVQFDAAAVKMAGGIDKFLKNLDEKIKTYALKTGQLSETIYGELFGSAESLRLLTSLTGEQSSKFTQNIAAMTDSAGTMDQAYAQVAQSSNFVIQGLKNATAAMTDWATSVAATATPYISFTANAALMVTQTTQVVFALRKAAAACKAFRVALATTGYGLVAVLIGLAGYEVYEEFAKKNEEAADAVDQLTEAEKRQADAAKDAQTVEESVKRTKEDVIAKLNEHINRLKAFNGTQEQQRSLVIELNGVYGKTMGYFKSVSAWYEALTKNSKKYTAQMVIEAQARALANQAAMKQVEADELREKINRGGFSRERTTHLEERQMVDSQGRIHTYQQEVADVGSSAYEKAIAQLKVLNDEIDRSKRKVEGLLLESAKIKFDVTGSPTAPDMSIKTDKKTPKTKHAKTDEEKLKELEKKVPKTLATLKDAENTLAYLNAKRRMVDGDEAAIIDGRIADINRWVQAEYEGAHEVELTWDNLQDFVAEGLDVGDLSSLDLARRKLSQLDEQLDDATTAEARAELGKQREEVERLIESLEREARVRVDTGADAVRTLEDIDAAVQQLREDEQRASADNVLGIERQITALDRKRSVLERGSRIAEMESEVAELRQLTSKDFTVEVRDIGFDRLTKKIKELQRMLSDTDNPLTGDQADAVRGLIGEYEHMRSKSVDVFATMREGVESVMGVGDSFKSLTETLRGDGDAWDKVTAVIRTGLGLWDAVNGIIQIATKLSAAFAPVKVAEGTAQGTAAGATVAATSTTVAAQAVQIASNQAATSSFAELAAAEYHAAHAMIPFVGAALASGFTATMMGEIAAAKLLALESGGLAYGPTSALIGEYAGARSNPEVVAPLNKLRDIIEPSMGGEVEFKIDGRVLRGVLKKTENLSARS